MPPRKKPSKFKRRTACDGMFSKLVRARDGACVICGANEYLQCAHGFSRSYHAVRWDFRNAWALCRSHHVYFTHRPLEWDEWLHKVWGDAQYAELRALALTHRWPDMEALHAELKERVQELVA